MLRKKQKSVELSSKKISFTRENILYKVIRFYPSKMSVDVMVFENKVKQGIQNMAFAQLTKEIKKLIKPN